MVWLWVLLAFALTPVLGGTFWALATEGAEPPQVGRVPQCAVRPPGPP